MLFCCGIKHGTPGTAGVFGVVGCFDSLFSWFWISAAMLVLLVLFVWVSLGYPEPFRSEVAKRRRRVPTPNRLFACSNALLEYRLTVRDDV